MLSTNQTMSYQFINEKGSFTLEQPQNSSYMYFPLCNDAGMKSAISPDLHGDTKLNQNTFLLEPVSSENLHNTNGGRNFWVLVNKAKLWSLNGNSAYQKSLFNGEEEEVSLEAGFLYHALTRTSKALGLKAKAITFVPNTEDLVEVTKYELTNITDQTMTIEATGGTALYGRSADNYRDHRQVTSLLHRITTNQYGVAIKPTLSFDERGHVVNETIYGNVLRASKGAVIGHIETMEVLIGEGGSLDYPRALFNRGENMSPVDTAIDGYEAVGGTCFEEIELAPGESVTYFSAIYIDENGAMDAKYKTENEDQGYAKTLSQTYCNEEGFNKHLQATKDHWQEKVDVIKIETADPDFDRWMQWVNIQPILRRIYGCSFLPHHDYGRGGRGWRDLWQDCLALLLMEPEEVGFLLHNNFAGIRIDGTNATIIGDKPGEFVADRNNISRTWMDHGAWPWLTTKEYIHQTGDIDFLFKEQEYFKDQLHRRSKEILQNPDLSKGNKLLNKAGEIHTGTVLEHLLVQNMSIFYNVGAHNILKLEDADWNDALDMAAELGESVAFSALYASNIKEIANMLSDLEDKGIKTVTLTKELMILFEEVDYNSIEAKHALLNKYFDSLVKGVDGEKLEIEIASLVANMTDKYKWMTNHIEKQEFITNKEGYSWFNSYYDNSGNRVEGDFPSGTRMMLTGQVFALMGGVGSKEQVAQAAKSAKHYLQDEKVGGYRLNTDFKEIKHDLGRAFGFAYGHKENGAMFSHMAVMYSNSLYKRGFVKDAYQVIADMQAHCQDFNTSRIYPSVPEYINERGRGMYTYLTGSASWMIYTVVNEMFGAKCSYGDLMLEPKLTEEQFKDGKASITFLFDKKPLTVNYILGKDGQEGLLVKKGQTTIISKDEINRRRQNGENEFDIILV